MSSSALPSAGADSADPDRELDETRAALRWSLAIYRALARNLPDCAVLVFDHELRYLFADGAERLSPVERRLAGRTLGEIEPAENLGVLEAVYRAALAGETHDTELRRGERTFALHTAPVSDGNGRVLAGLVIAREVTAQRQVEAALREQRLAAAIQAGVAFTANESTTLADALIRSIDLICSRTGWALGHAFIPSETSPHELIASEIWNEPLEDCYRPFRAATARARSSTELAIVRRAICERRPIWIGDLAESGFQRGQAAIAGGLKSGLIFPVFAGAEVAAVLEFYATWPEPPELGLIEVMSSVGVQLGRVVERERAHQALEQMSLVDELTHLYNRRGFLMLAQQQLELAHREHRRLFLIFADLDGMKPINDQLGHEVGDLALIEAAEILKRSFRSADLVARLGGDEFVVLATENGACESAMLTARIEAQLALSNAQPDRRYALAISTGVTASDPDLAQPIEALLSRADQSMYQQKRARKLRP
ncbi:MAG: diguanylate cyclase domain-containing protein [Polyangia bacterium]